MRHLTLAILIGTLTACGSATSDTSSTAQFGQGFSEPIGDAPTIISASSIETVENRQALERIRATDPDGDELGYAVTGGEDADEFGINRNGKLFFRTAANFELPRDRDQDNIYQVTVTVSDGSASDSIDLTVSVVNDREGIAVRRVVNRGFTQPTFLSDIPGSDNVFVIEKAGSIYELNPATGAKTLVRTLGDIDSSEEGGLLGIAVDPDYQQNGYIYVFVTNEDGNSEIRRLSRDGSPPPEGNRALLTIFHPEISGKHFAGWMGFGPDNLLYITTGDGRRSDRAQKTASKLGKILRIGITQNPAAGAASPYYYIPSGNPFASGGGDPTVFALGFRNPFRASFFDGGLLIADVGQNEVEEVDILRFNGGGTNFGWPFREGTLPYKGTAPGGLTDPVTQYRHGDGPREGNSITGGAVYTGSIADLRSDYIFADFASGNIWSVPLAALLSGTMVPSSDYERRNADFTPDRGSIDRVAGFWQSANGDFYIVDIDGDIFVIEPA